MWLVLHKYKLPIEWSVINQSPVNSGWFFLASGDISQGGCQYKHLLCVLPWAPPAAPPLWNNLVGSVFASRCCAGCWSWAADAIVWELLPKISLFSQQDLHVAGKIICSFSSCFHLLGGGNECNTADGISESWRKQMTRYELLLKLYLFGIICVEPDYFWRTFVGLWILCKLVRFSQKCNS